MRSLDDIQFAGIADVAKMEISHYVLNQNTEPSQLTYVKSPRLFLFVVLLMR